MKYNYLPPQMQEVLLQGGLPLAASATGGTPDPFGRDAGDGGMFNDLDINPVLPW